MSTFDPFADDAPAADAAHTDTAAAGSGDRTPAPAANAAAPVGGDDQNYVTVILKGGTGYGAPSISIRGGSIPDALAQMKGHDDDLKELVQAAAKYGKAFGRIVDGDKPQAGGGGQAQERPAHQSAPGGEERYCKHGSMEFKSGMSKAGNSYKGFFCPSRDRADQCKPQFMK